MYVQQQYECIVSNICKLIKSLENCLQFRDTAKRYSRRTMWSSAVQPSAIPRRTTRSSAIRPSVIPQRTTRSSAIRPSGTADNQHNQPRTIREKQQITPILSETRTNIMRFIFRTNKTINFDDKKRIFN